MTTKINIRIPQEIKNKIEELSIERGMTISEIARNIFDHYFCSDKKDPELDILQTLGFSELIFWLYNKREYPGINETDELYEQFIDLIYRMKFHELFNDEILLEFNKVSHELTRHLSNMLANNELDFAIEGSSNSFNYDLLAEFMYTLRYDEQDNRILNIE